MRVIWYLLFPVFLFLSLSVRHFSFRLALSLLFSSFPFFCVPFVPSVLPFAIFYRFFCCLLFSIGVLIHGHVKGVGKCWTLLVLYVTLNHTRCPTTYQTRHFFNNSKTNEGIATRFEQEYVRCVRNVTTP